MMGWHLLGSRFVDVFAAEAARGAAEEAENATPSRRLQLYATAFQYQMQTLRLLMAEVRRRVMGWRRARMAPHIYHIVFLTIF